MVVARQHVAGAQADVLQVAAVEHALLVGLGDAVRPCGRRGEEQACREERPGKTIEHILLS